MQIALWDYILYFLRLQTTTEDVVLVLGKKKDSTCAESYAFVAP